jgi:hypothetical protein
MNNGDSRNKQITITSVKIQQNPMHHVCIIQETGTLDRCMRQYPDDDERYQICNLGLKLFNSGSRSEVVTI